MGYGLRFTPFKSRLIQKIVADPAGTDHREVASGPT